MAEKRLTSEQQKMERTLARTWKTKISLKIEVSAATWHTTCRAMAGAELYNERPAWLTPHASSSLCSKEGTKQAQTT